MHSLVRLAFAVAALISHCLSFLCVFCLSVMGMFSFTDPVLGVGWKVTTTRPIAVTGHGESVSGKFPTTLPNMGAEGADWEITLPNAVGCMRHLRPLVPETA